MKGKRTVLLFVFVVSLVLLLFSLNLKSRSTPLEDFEIDTDGFEYAWVTFSTNRFLDFIVEDSIGNRTGYNPETKTTFKDIPSSSYSIGSIPGGKIDQTSGVKIFEVKVYDDYDFKITLFGSEETEYFYDYSMLSNVPETHSAREVKTNLIFDPERENIVNFSYDF